MGSEKTRKDISLQLRLILSTVIAYKNQNIIIQIANPREGDTLVLIYHINKFECPFFKNIIKHTQKQDIMSHSKEKK